MKRVTYGMPPACQHCGATDAWKSGDWTYVTCTKCGKNTSFVVLKIEEVPNEP